MHEMQKELTKRGIRKLDMAVSREMREKCVAAEQNRQAEGIYWYPSSRCRESVGLPASVKSIKKRALLI